MYLLRFSQINPNHFFWPLDTSLYSYFLIFLKLLAFEIHRIKLKIRFSWRHAATRGRFYILYTWKCLQVISENQGSVTTCCFGSIRRLARCKLPDIWARSRACLPVVSFCKSHSVMVFQLMSIIVRASPVTAKSTCYLTRLHSKTRIFAKAERFDFAVLKDACPPCGICWSSLDWQHQRVAGSPKSVRLNLVEVAAVLHWTSGISGPENWMVLPPERRNTLHFCKSIGTPYSSQSQLFCGTWLPGTSGKLNVWTIHLWSL